MAPETDGRWRSVLTGFSGGTWCTCGGIRRARWSQRATPGSNPAEERSGTVGVQRHVRRREDVTFDPPARRCEKGGEMVFEGWEEHSGDK